MTESQIASQTSLDQIFASDEYRIMEAGYAQVRALGMDDDSDAEILRDGLYRVYGYLVLSIDAHRLVIAGVHASYEAALDYVTGAAARAIAENATFAS